MDPAPCVDCGRARVERACGCTGCAERLAICACPRVMAALVGSRGLCAACRALPCAPGRACQRVAGVARSRTTRRNPRARGRG